METSRAVREETQSAGAHALQIRGIKKNFDAFTALRNIDLDVRQGEMLCLLGPSGCGKTTLLRIIAGLESQTAGTILQKGKDISHLPPYRRDYGIVFQSYALFPNLTIADNVAYGLVNRRMKRDDIQRRVTELLKLVGLPTSGKKYPSQLSGGQQQRVALARALATNPGLLLLDEPLSALDALERIRLRGEIRRLQQQVGVTTILVTHDQEEALSMADRIVVMNHGVIEQVGSPQEIYERPATAFVADFIGKVNVLSGTSLGDKRFRVGALELFCENSSESHPSGTAVNLYLRPEDRILENITDATPHQFDALINRIEFLGASCIAEVSCDELQGQSLSFQFSLNQLHDYDIREGKRLRLALRANRIRTFASSRA